MRQIDANKPHTSARFRIERLLPGPLVRLIEAQLQSPIFHVTGHLMVSKRKLPIYNFYFPPILQLAGWIDL